MSHMFYPNKLLFFFYTRIMYDNQFVHKLPICEITQLEYT